MYKLVGADGLGNFAIYDTDTDFTEAITGADLKLCLNVGLSVAGAFLNGNGDVEYTNEFFPKAMEFDDEDEEEDEWEDSDEDWGESEESEDYEDYEDYEDDESDDYESYDDDEEDEYDFDLDDEDDDLIYDDYGEAIDIVTNQEDSSMSKLFSRLTDEQISVLQEYYLYISQRIFDLKTGNAKLNVKKSKDLDALRDTGGTWHYAGFMDMGYAGSSVCPSCRASMTHHAISQCCEAPIITYRSKDGSEKRTFNGTCQCCGSRCSAVTRKVALREINRTNQVGVLCEVCNSELEQSSHYCTFNHPVRFMHIAWDVSKTDIEVGLFGQLATQKLEDIIDSNNCIKFGLECIADFFDIPRNSDAFKALKDVQDTCISDMKSLEKTYSAYESDLTQVTNTFTFTDEIVNLIGAYNAKALFMKKDPIMPERLITCYKKIRELNMIPPKSLIQYIRDYLVDWKDHKFSDGCKKYPSLKFSIGCIHGARSNYTDGLTSHIVLADNISKMFGKSAEELCKFIKQNMGKNYMLVDAGWSRAYYKFGYSSVGSIVAYLTSAFIYEICGFYKYNALPSTEPNSSTDEGGSSRDAEGKHIKELDTFYNYIDKQFFSDYNYSVDYIKKLIILFSTAEECSTFADEFKSDSLKLNEKTGFYERRNDYTLNIAILEKYEKMHCDADNLISAINSACIYKSINYGKYSCCIALNKDFNKMTIDEALQTFQEYKNVMQSNLEDFKSFRETNLDNAIRHKNKQIQIEREQAEKQKLLDEEKRVEVEERKKQQALNNKMSSGKDVVDFLSKQDLSGVSSDFDFAKMLVSQLSKSGKEPSSKQLYYINSLYREVTGNQPELASSTEVTLLDNRKDIEEAIDWCLEHKNKLDSERTASILTSIKRYRKISVKQMKYAEIALKLYDENK